MLDYFFFKYIVKYIVKYIDLFWCYIISETIRPFTIILNILEVLLTGLFIFIFLYLVLTIYFGLYSSEKDIQKNISQTKLELLLMLVFLVIIFIYYYFDLFDIYYYFDLFDFSSIIGKKYALAESINENNLKYNIEKKEPTLANL